MDYSQFLNMIPEATLMLALIIVFCADFALSKSPRKTYVLSILTGLQQPSATCMYHLPSLM